VSPETLNESSSSLMGHIRKLVAKSLTMWFYCKTLVYGLSFGASLCTEKRQIKSPFCFGKQSPCKRPEHKDMFHLIAVYTDRYFVTEITN
jgi:hypothetical protein